jgi:hypothetical protein
MAREELRSVLSQLSLHPESNSRGSWAGTSEFGHLQLRLQLAKRNYGDSSDGYEFAADLQRSEGKLAAGARLFSLLTHDELEEHRAIQNQVIAKLPLDEASLESLPPKWQADRLARVAPRLAPYPPTLNLDLWFRYLDEEDVRRWMKFIGRVLPGAFGRLVPIARERGRARPTSKAELLAEYGDPLADERDVRDADEAMRRLLG